MRTFTVCTANSRQSAVWSAKQISFEELCDRLRTPLRTEETVAQYHKMAKPEKDQIKDKGGFMAGTLKGVRRRKSEVVSRSIITLDADKMKPGFIEEYELIHQKYLSLIYTTHSHTQEKPRARILIFLSKDVTPDEYNAIARLMAAEFDIGMFDPVSFEVNQLMYWPTCPCDGEYIFRSFDGPLLDPAAYLAAYPGWEDPTKLPQVPGEEKMRDPSRRKQEDPLVKKGIVGAYCRTYSISDVMANELSDVYAVSDIDDDRYDYIPGEGSNGVVVYDDKFVYSHHATDPAGGKLLNAFDLVRVHKFGDDDAKQSFNAMAEYAGRDEAVRAHALEERIEEAKADFDDWKKRLRFVERTARLENSLFNIKLIMQNDPYMKNIVFNQLADNMEIKGDVPWVHPAKFWRDADDAQLMCYVDDNYGSFSQHNYDVAVTKAVDDRSYHPIREYFSALPPWDGTPRVDSAVIDYLGADDNAYVRAATRKALCAAYRRVHEPGVKFDYMLVFNGAQGIGKSTFIANLGMEWFSDSLTLSDMNDKTAAEKLQGYWIIEIGELAGMKKADLDKVKAFISRCDDKYRASFGRRVTPHPRQCVFFGTTNSENGYLRDITGNRRFWNIKVTGDGKYKPWDMNPETVAQIWAETAVLAKNGEKLFLPPELEEYAKAEQRSAMERDDREGLIEDYLDMLLPDDWDTMEPEQRRDYFSFPNDPTRPVGTHQRNAVSNIEIWCECLGKRKEDMRPSDSYAIAAVMSRLGGWSKTAERKRVPGYGLQRIYRRL